MIGSLRGFLQERLEDGQVLVEVAGVGYRVTVTPTTSVSVGEVGQEISLHIPWLYQQKKVIDPILIVLIGSSALQSILGSKYKISKTRGTWHNWNGICVTTIYHPSYLLRNPSRSPGRPYDLTCLDLYEVKKKFSELESFSKKSTTYIPIIN